MASPTTCRALASRHRDTSDPARDNVILPKPLEVSLGRIAEALGGKPGDGYMANVTLHKKLDALGTVTPEAMDSIAQKVEARVALQLENVKAQLADAKRSLEETINQRRLDLQSALTTKFDAGVKGIVDAVYQIEKPIGPIRKEAFGVLIALNQAEGIATDQTPNLKVNNATLVKLSKRGGESAFEHWLSLLPGELHADFSKVFRPFDKGNEQERAARCLEIHEFRAKALRFFAASEFRG